MDRAQTHTLILTHKRTLTLCVHTHAHVWSHTILQKENASFGDMSIQHQFPLWTPASTRDDLYEGLRTGLSGVTKSMW